MCTISPEARESDGAFAYGALGKKTETKLNTTLEHMDLKHPVRHCLIRSV